MAVTISNGLLTATISEKGAELISLIKNGKEFMWEGNPYYWGKHSPVLFPIVGTLKNNRYTTGGREYELGRHGFARDNDFIVHEQTPDGVTFVLTENDKTLLSYPFRFELKLRYKLIGGALEMNYEVKNTGDTLMPYSLGAHPAFALDSDIGNYSIAFPDDNEIVYHHLNNDLICRQTSTLKLTHHQLLLSREMFDKDALVIKTLGSRKAILLKEDQPVITIAFADFPNLGLWTKPGAPFFCIEPWQGYADVEDSIDNSIERKEGIRLLDVNDLHSYKLSITPES